VIRRATSTAASPAGVTRSRTSATINLIAAPTIPSCVKNRLWPLAHVGSVALKVVGWRSTSITEHVRYEQVRHVYCFNQQSLSERKP